jgi:Protein of unknown function (DUF2958)
MKLLTKAIQTQLLRAAEGAHQYNEHSKVIVKFFTPDAQASWFILEGRKTSDTDWELFGFCSLGDPDLAELGYVTLSELLSVHGHLGLPVERELYWTGTLGDAYKEVGRS